jgi:CheY-like chemotaxis protein/DNA-binding CsgD family transcriptional regulator
MSDVRILILDDDPDILQTMEFIFKVYEPGFQLTLLDEPRDAVETIKKTDPDVIITDWEMPGMNGIEVIKEIRKHKQFDAIPIIMATGVMGGSKHLEIALAAGANDFILKPLDHIVMIARTRSMVTLSQTMRNLHLQNSIILENNNFIRSLLRSVPHPMAYYTIEGIIVEHNEKFEEFSECRANLRGSLIYKRYKEKTANIHLEADKELIRSGSIKNYETFDEADNSSFLHSKTLYLDAQGKPEGIMYIITDVTEIRNAQNEILENKKRELVSNALQLVQISETNAQLIEKLKDIAPYTNNHGKNLINLLMAEHSNTSNTIRWKEFETHFANVYEDFYKRLVQRHPELTPGERKLCAMLRLKLSTKEIATLTLQNPQTIDIARYRIRKKLQLSQDINLVSYLSGF